MENKYLSRICFSLLAGVSICMSGTGTVFAAEGTEIAEEAETTVSEGAEKKELVDLTAFCTNGKYRYKGVPWLSSKEEAEEVLGVSLEAVDGQSTKMGNLRSPVEFQGESGWINVCMKVKAAECTVWDSEQGE